MIGIFTKSAKKRDARGGTKPEPKANKRLAEPNTAENHAFSKTSPLQKGRNGVSRMTLA